MTARISQVLKDRRGMLRADRLLGDVGGPLTAPPHPPKHLSPAAKSEWLRLAPLIVAAVQLSACDLFALELLCETLADEREWRAKVRVEGVAVPSESGSLKGNPALKAMETARAQAARLLVEFGLTPRSRQGVATPPPLRPDNPFARNGVKPGTY